MSLGIRSFEECIEKITYGTKVQKADYLQEGSFPIVSQEIELINGYWNKKEDVFEIEKPVIIFGDHTRTLKYVDFNFVLGADGTKIIKPREFIDSKFFFYFLQANQIESKGYSRHYKFLKQLKLNVPPLSTQQKIATKLDSILAEIEKAAAATEASIKNAEALFQSYLAKLFEQRGEGWGIKKLQDLCENYKQDIVDGPFGSELKRDDYIASGVPVLKIQNIKPFEIILKKMDFISEKKFLELRRHSYKNGDIIMTKLGSPLGVCAIAKDLDDGVIVADLVRIRANKINAEYLCYFLNSKKTNSYINEQQKGTTRPRVRLNIVREIPVKVPPIEIQKEILQEIKDFSSLINKQINARKAVAANLPALKNSILYKIFNSNLVEE
jgi:type I restriction enzyme S subunit